MAEFNAELQKFINSVLESNINIYPYHDFSNIDYNNFKITTIPAGTTFKLRSMYPIKRLNDKYIWADFSAKSGFPFVEIPVPKNLDIMMYPKEIMSVAKFMIHKFGPYVNTIELTKDLNILHFPYKQCDYNSIDSFSAYIEGIVRYSTERITYMLPEDKKIHGYTLDFINFNPNLFGILPKQYDTDIPKVTSVKVNSYTSETREYNKSFSNYREICFFSNYGIQLKNSDTFATNPSLMSNNEYIRQISLSVYESTVPWAKRVVYPLKISEEFPEAPIEPPMSFDVPSLLRKALEEKRAREAVEARREREAVEAKRVREAEEAIRESEAEEARRESEAKEHTSIDEMLREAQRRTEEEYGEF